MQVDMSSVIFRAENREQLLEQCRKTGARLGYDWGVQLHNSEDEETVDYLSRQKVRLSAHAPLLQQARWNFAAESMNATWDAVAENVRLFRRLGITDAVFHGFIMCDRPIRAFGRGVSYDEAMKSAFRPELAMFPDRTLNNDFTGSEEFLKRRDAEKKNLAELCSRFPGTRFCIENDFPSYGAGNMLPKDIVSLEHPVCLDSAHLWATCKLFGVDYHTAVSEMLDSGLVRMVHLHASGYNDSTPVKDWGDGHRPLATPNGMDLPRLVRNCLAHGVQHFVLEVFAGTPADMEILAQWCRI